MIAIALTGGVATGKSTVLAAFRRIWEDRTDVFSADAAVHELLTTGPIKTNVQEVFGKGVFDADGEIDRSELRKIVFRNESQRRRLEGILHPAVHSLYGEFEKQALEDRKHFLIYEIPLLYEVESQLIRNHDVVVAASESVQRKRLEELRKLEADIIDGILEAQMPLAEKMRRADFVIWNESSIAELNEQVALLTDWIEESEA